MVQDAINSVGKAKRLDLITPRQTLDSLFLTYLLRHGDSFLRFVS